MAHTTKGALYNSSYNFSSLRSQGNTQTLLSWVGYFVLGARPYPVAKIRVRSLKCMNDKEIYF